MEAINLNKVFSQGFFRIPDYQRGYSWSEKQLNELWDDIDEIREIDGEFKKHYTGTLFLEKTDSSASEKWVEDDFYFVVDGQQRLTTLSIFLFELLKQTDKGYLSKDLSLLRHQFLFSENSSGNSKVFRFGYQESDKNYNFLIQQIFENKAVLLKEESINLYANNLNEAKLFFFNKISHLSFEEKEKLFKKITTCLIFDIRKIEKDLDVQAVFETMNNRGKPLTTLEKLKNRLIYLNDKLEQPEEDKNLLRKNINDGWGKIYNALAQNPLQYLDEDEFLSAHLSLYRKPKESVFSEKIAEIKVFEMFCNRSEKYFLDESQKMEPKVTHKKINDYVLALSDFAPVWFKVNNSNNLLIEKILLLNSSKDLKIFIATLLIKVDNLQKQNELLRILEKILFRNRVPGIWIMDERNTATWARTLYNSNELTIEKIEEVQKEMEEYLEKEIITEYVVKGFTALFTYVRGAVGFHRWSALKYFLFEYDSALQKKFGEHHHKVSLSDYAETSIEHVMPQDYYAYWLDEVREFSDKFETDDDKYFAEKVLLNSLGNLTILKNGKNSSLKNYSWNVKKERFETGSYNEIDISKKPSWNKIEIYNRGTDLLKFLETKIPGLHLTKTDIENCLFYNEDISEKIFDSSK